MNTTQDDGGPAFPESASGPYPNGEVVVGRPGMSLRDWFAGMALQGMVGPALVDAARQRVKPESVPPKLAEGAYAISDAMLAERKEAK